MDEFLQMHARDVIGVLSGFDRLVFRGTIRQLAYVKGMMSYLSVCSVLLKDFAEHALSMTKQLKDAVTRAVEERGRPVIYLSSSTARKEDLARELARRDGVTEGTIGLFTCIEPCRSYEVYRNRETKKLELKYRNRKCLFMYHYYFHPNFGFMHARIQTWFPFNIQVCINGREWLAQQMAQQSIGFQRRDNCFVSLEDAKQAQELMNQQLRVNWPTLLNGIAHDLNPAHNSMFTNFLAPYYWSVYQSEWATDVMFRDSESLAAVYPRLVRHGIQSFSSPDVMRFLGRKVPSHGRVDRRFQGEVTSGLKHRPEGVRIKHRLNGNSIKLYDKHGQVLRFETTINKPKDFKVFRPTEGEEHGTCDWRPLRQGVADLNRRAHVSNAANERYAQALAAVHNDTPLGKQVAKLCQPTTLNGRRVRALRPWSQDDFALLQAVNRGEFSINGMRNRDLRELLCNPATTAEERRRQSARITRKLRLLRAHGLLKKVPRTHRYQLTSDGRKYITAILAAHATSTTELANIAA